MPTWNITMAVNILGVGGINAKQKTIVRPIDAPTLSDAIALAGQGLLTVQVVAGSLADPNDPTVPAVPVVP